MIRRCAVVGSPIEHSLSPLIHAAAYRVLGIEDGWRYGRHEITEGDLADFVYGCGPEWVGLSCTAPLKRVLLELGEPSDRARLLHAGNTLLFGRDGAPARVENTDVTGLLGALSRIGVNEASRALLVGSGATARSALFALADIGVGEALVLVRSQENARASLGGLAATLGIAVEYGTWGTVPDVDEVDVLVSTVASPLPDAVAAGLIRLTKVCFDATYNHYPTVLDRAARSAGIGQLSGIDLLVGQALEQILMFTGMECPPEPLLATAYAALA